MKLTCGMKGEKKVSACRCISVDELKLQQPLSDEYLKHD